MKNDQHEATDFGKRFLLATATGIILSVRLIALASTPVQTPTPAARLEFEAVSIKPAPPGARGGGGRVLPSGRLESKNVTLKYMMTVAYSVTNYQIVGSSDLLEGQT